MGLVPEFFIVLGIFIFLALSFLSALLDEDFPSILQYLLQGAAAGGLGLLLISQRFINGGIISPNPTDPTRFSISVGYLASAISIAAGLNIYLAIVRRKMALSSALSGAVTVPIFMISATLVSSFLGAGGEVSFTSTTILILAMSALVSLSILGFLREAHKHIRNSSGGHESLPTVPVSMPPTQGEIDWVDLLRKESEDRR